MPTACTNTHTNSQHVQGPGVCCAALAASGKVASVGLRLQATDKKGKCFVCEVAPSTSKRAAPGQLKFKRGKSAGICPTSSLGCCSLNAVSLGQQ